MLRRHKDATEKKVAHVMGIRLRNAIREARDIKVVMESGESDEDGDGDEDEDY